MLLKMSRPRKVTGIKVQKEKNVLDEKNNALFYKREIIAEMYISSVIDSVQVSYASTGQNIGPSCFDIM